MEVLYEDKERGILMIKADSIEIEQPKIDLFADLEEFAHVTTIKTINLEEDLKDFISKWGFKNIDEFHRYSKRFTNGTT